MPVTLPNPEKLHLVVKDSVGKEIPSKLEIPASGGDPKLVFTPHHRGPHHAEVYVPDQKRIQIDVEPTLEK